MAAKLFSLYFLAVAGLEVARAGMSTSLRPIFPRFAGTLTAFMKQRL